MGYPVAFDASADERETRGFISITRSSPVTRLRANWMFEPPVSTPTARTTAIALSRSSWYASSLSVICGATVTESPVCTPIGSRFALEHAEHALEVERLEVRAVGEARVGHDRGRVRVDDDRAVAVLAQHLQRLAARVVELARLADHDRARSDQADRLEITPPWHHTPPRPTSQGKARHRGVPA